MSSQDPIRPVPLAYVMSCISVSHPCHCLRFWFGLPAGSEPSVSAPPSLCALLFLDVMLLCFVLQRLKINPYLAGHGLQIWTVLCLMRACKLCSCLFVWHKVVGLWSESFTDTWRHKEKQGAGAAKEIVSPLMCVCVCVCVCMWCGSECLHVKCAPGPGSPLSQLS